MRPLWVVEETTMGCAVGGAVGSAGLLLLLCQWTTQHVGLSCGLYPHTQERVFNWAMREHGAQGTITTASLLEFLRQEIQVRGGWRVAMCLTTVPTHCIMHITEYREPDRNTTASNTVSSMCSTTNLHIRYVPWYAQEHSMPCEVCVHLATHTTFSTRPGVQPSPAKRQETAFPQHGLEGQPGAFGGMTADMDECSESM